MNPMQSGAVTPAWARLLPLIVVLVIVAVRFLRPQRISVARMWIQPIILCGLTAWVIYINEVLNPAAPPLIAFGLVIGAAAGIPFGLLRGKHTNVRPIDGPGVMYLGSSWVTIAIFLGAFGLRYAVRLMMPQRGELASIVGDGCLAFAIAFIVTSYVAIYRKYLDEVFGKEPVAPVP
jgi:hypothetical protein